jgi:hypothetical protein
MSNSSTPARGAGLSLYANLLDPSAATTPGTVSRAPVVFKTGTADTPEEASAKKHQIDAGINRSVTPKASDGMSNRAHQQRYAFSLRKDHNLLRNQNQRHPSRNQFQIIQTKAPFLRQVLEAPLDQRQRARWQTGPQSRTTM